MTSELQAVREFLAPVGGLPLGDGFHQLRWQHGQEPALGAAWDALVERAGTPNPFFERWFLLPSLEALDPQGTVALGLFVEGGALLGLMPLVRTTSYHGRRLPHVSAWLHPNMFCGTPLVAHGCEEAFWEACLMALDERGGGEWFFHLGQMPARDPVTEALHRHCRQAGRSLRRVLASERAELNSADSPDTYFTRNMTAKARKELRRQRHRLADRSPLDFRTTRGTEEIGEWTEAFLALEAKGWKGKAGSALAANNRTASIFRTALAGAARRGRLERRALFCGGKPVAMLATFLAPPGAFAFKTAFDEDFARYSPGMLLQVDNLALLDDRSIRWCDSCAEPGHPMIERIWSERREMAFYSVAIGRGWRRRAGELWAWAEEWRQERRS